MEWSASLKDLVSAPAGAIASSLTKIKSAANVASEGLTSIGKEASASFSTARAAASDLLTKTQSVGTSLKSMGASAAARGVGVLSNAYTRLTAGFIKGNLDKESQKLARLKAAFENVNKGSSVKLSVAKSLQDQIKASEGKIAGFQSKLTAAGLSGKDLGAKSSLAAKGVSLLGAKASAAVQAVKYVGAAAWAASGGIVAFGARAALGWQGMGRLQAAGARLRFNLTQLFKGIDASPIVRAADRMVAFFDKSRTSGRVLGEVLNRAFTGLFRLLDKAAPYIETFALGLVYGALLVENAYLKTRLAILPVTSAISKLIGPVDLASAAFTAGAAVMVTVAAAAGILALVLVLLYIPTIALAAGVYYLVKGLIWIAEKLGLVSKKAESAAPAIQALADKVAAALPAAAAKGGKDAGSAIGDGMIDGMKGKLPNVESAAKSLVEAANKGVTTKAEIKSPSRLFRRTAGQMGEGAALGLKDSAPKVEKAAQMSLVPELPSLTKGGGSEAQAGTSGTTVYLSVGDIHVGNGGDKQTIREEFNSAVEAVMNRVFGQTKIELGFPAGV